jgi:murein L,D-transpeptidase YcbB/YkuD
LNNTVIFNDSLEFIVFSPYWNIPENILYKETIPAVKKNPNYLSKNNMEVVGKSGKVIDPGTINWSKYQEHFPYIVREKPGPNNSLGLVKFLFPNPYDIYMHDTPAKSLFNESSRAFSHGCIRVEDPLCLAEFLLRRDRSWSEEKIKKTMEGGQETFLKLKKKIPVFITYFTAWVDESGKLNFRGDVYGHDVRLSRVLFVN